MIKIEESTPRKLSGRTSLLIAFPFDQGVVDVIKALPTYAYHKKDRVWECPINCLARLVDSLTKIDDNGLAENHSKWLLCDGMGCGKTCESIYLAETLYRRGKIKHCLIICGVDSLRSN